MGEERTEAGVEQRTGASEQSQMRQQVATNLPLCSFGGPSLGVAPWSLHLTTFNLNPAHE